MIAEVHSYHVPRSPWDLREEEDQESGRGHSLPSETAAWTGLGSAVPSVPRTELSTAAGHQSCLQVGHLSEHPSSNISAGFFFFSFPPHQGPKRSIGEED